MYAHTLTSENFAGSGDGSASQITNLVQSVIKNMYTFSLDAGPPGLWSIDIGSQFIRVGNDLAPTSNAAANLGHSPLSGPTFYWNNGYFAGNLYCNAIITGATPGGGVLGSLGSPWQIFCDALNVVELVTSLIPSEATVNLALGAIDSAFAESFVATTATDSIGALSTVSEAPVTCTSSMVRSDSATTLVNVGSSSAPFDSIWGTSLMPGTIFDPPIFTIGTVGNPWNVAYIQSVNVTTPTSVVIGWQLTTSVSIPNAISTPPTGADTSQQFNSGNWPSDIIHGGGQLKNNSSTETYPIRVDASQIAFVPNATGYRAVNIQIASPSTAIAQSTTNAVSGTYTILSCSGVTMLAPGETIEILVTQTSGGALNIVPATIWEYQLLMI